MASTEQLGLNKTWELSLYELHRTPQDAITDNTEIAVSPRSLHSELMCPICLDMLKKTMTTKECLHRFCSDCIITALRSGNKECPTCRKKLVSKRSLRPDPNFDLLISKIYPSRDEYEAHQSKVLEKLHKSHSQAALMNSINEGIKLQNQNRLQRSKKSVGNDAENSQSHSLVTSANENSNSQPPNSSEAGTPSKASLSQPVMDETSQSSVSASIHKDESNGPKYPKRPKSVVTSENESENSSVAESGGQDSVTEGEGTSDMISPDEIELVFKPHPTEMGADNVLMKALKDNSTRYIKTTANASGKLILR